MKFSYQWISELVGDLSIAPSELEGLITVKTAECEGIEPFGAHFSTVKAVRILRFHPVGKGKNQAVTIEAGDGREVQVVCGAPNVREGLLTAWVPPGTDLDSHAIGVAAIDGVESQGMLASAAELGISRDNSGILELPDGPPGVSLSNLRPDWIIEIDNKSLTHRPDLWGHVGMAREVAAIAGRTLRDPVDLSVLHEGPSPFSVKIEDHALCPRYSALLLENIAVGPSPLSLQARLQSVGLNPINNIVDITNFVLAELPQPMHAFDADKLEGATIFVRRARSGERLKALNGETYNLHADDLVIADAAGPIALAGVIGGADSAISAGTKRVLLESANFAPTGVRLTSARHKVRTDASMRFEKSLDPENTLRGLARAVALCGNSVSVGGVIDNIGPRHSIPPIALPVEFVSRKLGTPLAVDQITSILGSLGFGVAESTPGLLTVTVPSWRATKDISHKDDLVEEVGRMIGYDQIALQAPLVASVVPPANPLRTYFRQVRSRMADQGFTEVYNYSFIGGADAARFGLAPGDLLAVINPIAAEMTHLRSSLLPGLWKNIVDNVRHFREFRLFELGSAIARSGEETPHLAAVLFSAHADERDLFELKRVLECLLPSAALHAASPRLYQHPTRAADITWHGSPVGQFFELHPSLLQDEGIEGRAMLFDINLQQTQVIFAGLTKKYVPPRKYPTSGLDLSVLTAVETPVAEIHDGLKALGSSDLAQVRFIDQYEGPPLPSGQKSVTYHLEIGALDHTVTAEEVSGVRNRIIEGMRVRGFQFRA